LLSWHGKVCGSGGDGDGDGDGGDRMGATSECFVMHSHNEHLWPECYCAQTAAVVQW